MISISFSNCVIFSNFKILKGGFSNCPPAFYLEDFLKMASSYIFIQLFFENPEPKTDDKISPSVLIKMMNDSDGVEA